MLELDINKEQKQKRRNPLNYIYPLIPVIIIILIAVVISQRYPELPKILTSPQKVRAFISKFGMQAPIIFVSLQVFQIIFAPIPGYFIELVGGYLFGIKGLMFCVAGIVIGSSIAFWVGRIFGRNLLQLFIPHDRMHKFDEYVVHKGPFIIFLLFLFSPLGDICYYLSGLTPIPYLIYLVMVLVARLPTNIAYNIVGSKAFSLTLQEWIIVIAILAILAMAFYFNRKHIEYLIVRYVKY